MRLHFSSHWQVSFIVHIFRANMNNIFFHECRLASRCNNSRSKLACLNRQKGRMEQKEDYLVTIVHTFILIKFLNRWKHAVVFGFICEYAVKDGIIFNSFRDDSFAFQCISIALRSKINLVPS